MGNFKHNLSQEQIDSWRSAFSQKDIFKEEMERILNKEHENLRTKIYQLITNERQRQNHKHSRSLGDDALPILVEEVGEVAKAMFENNPEDLKEELVHVAAVAVRFLEEIELGLHNK